MQNLVPIVSLDPHCMQNFFPCPPTFVEEAPFAAPPFAFDFGVAPPRPGEDTKFLFHNGVFAVDRIGDFGDFGCVCDRGV